MKIINVMFSKVNGGLEQAFLNYTDALTLQGHHVIPIIHPQAEIRNFCPKEHLIMVHNYNQYDVFAIHKLKKLIQQKNPDCIITHSYRAAYLLKKTKTSVPKIAVCHVRGHYNFGTDALIALTESMRQEIIQSGRPEHTVFTVPNMIPMTQELTYRRPKERQIPIIGACARFTGIKGIDVLIHALGELKKRGVVFQAKIAGDGAEKTAYEQMIAHYQLQDQVQLLGWITNKSEFYQNIDYFCLPSREESFGLVLLESMMHSLPMVVTHLPGPKEVIGDSQSALFVPPEDPISMASSLEHLIKNKELTLNLSKNAFDRAKAYSQETIGPLLSSVLRKVCNT